MAESIIVNKTASIDEQYNLLVKQVKSLLERNDNIISNLSNFTAAMKQTFEKISWVGFYLFDGNELYLGPFQGKVACTRIQLGKGVCGTSAEKRQTIIVPDVNEFPGHIVCDVESRSEIVVPIVKGDRLYGVLDVDSSRLNAFNETDKIYLEEMVNYLVSDIM
ncbi:MAG: GAF domain-containing protein [Ignavibacteriaceae bacterium]